MNTDHPYQARHITTADWYEHVRTWSSATSFDAEASISPDSASARMENSWTITVRLGAVPLEPGDHLAVEVGVGFTPDRGRPFVYDRAALLDEWNPGYGATPCCEFPEGVSYDLAVTRRLVVPKERMDRYYIIDICITEGTVAAGSVCIIKLADPRGTLLRCPWFAQNFPIPIAVRKRDEPHYRRLASYPILKVRGGMPRLWKVAAALQPGGRSARVQVIAADLENLNPSHEAPDPNMLIDGDIRLVEPFRRENGYHGAPVWRTTVAVKETGISRIEVLNRDIGLYGRSSPIVPDLHGENQVFFGDLHGQSSRSIGYGTEDEYFSWARDAELLDFVAPANHYGGRERVSQELWRETLALCDAYYDPGSFVTLLSYEWGTARYAHRNVYYEEKAGGLFYGMDPSFDDIGKLWAALEAQGLKVLTVPHHVKFIGRIDWRECHPEFQRLVEVCSCWGNSEQYGPHSVIAGLNMGHRLGVTGGTDTHFSQPGRSAFGPFDTGGLTAVICSSLERSAVWDALYHRRCYATTGERILMEFSLNGSPMGSELQLTDKRTISGRIIGTAPLTEVRIMRNGKLWKSAVLDGSEETVFSFEDTDEFSSVSLDASVLSGSPFIYYYAAVSQQDRHWAMSSPIWVTEGIQG